MTPEQREDPRWRDGRLGPGKSLGKVRSAYRLSTTTVPGNSQNAIDDCGPSPTARSRRVETGQTTAGETSHSTITTMYGGLLFAILLIAVGIIGAIAGWFGILQWGVLILAGLCLLPISIAAHKA